jgi:transcription initiation factor TFIIIB Brf1 subunit/transcription initiation factor TFIIB
MKRAGELRQKAERYRRLKIQVSDQAAVKAICELAGELEMTAAELERHHHVRERAHQIWLEQGCPGGRDLDHWVAAEHEMENWERGRIRRRA